MGNRMFYKKKGVRIMSPDEIDAFFKMQSKFDKEQADERRKNVKEKSKKYYLDNRQKIIEYQKNYRKERLENDDLFKCSIKIRSNILTSIKRKGYSKKTKTYKILGCDYDFFKSYIEAQFKEGMTWENHGQWHFDHIIPVSFAKSEEELIRLSHYSNFQPLWAEENLSKSNKIEWTTN